MPRPARGFLSPPMLQTGIAKQILLLYCLRRLQPVKPMNAKEVS